MRIVLAAYSSDRTPAALAFCERLSKGLGSCRRILVANHPALAESLQPAGWLVIRGSNALGEFSAWQEGLDATAAIDADDAAVLFVNDTVVSHRWFSAFRRWALVREIWCSDRPSVVGFIDHPDDATSDLHIGGLRLPGWISSYCFLLTPGALRRLDHRLWDPDAVGACVAGGVHEATFFSDQVSPDLQRHLRWWLFHGGWYRSEPLTAASAERLAFKARCVCAELLLSARCWALGCEYRDPFERHPLPRALERRSYSLALRFGPPERARSANRGIGMARRLPTRPHVS